VTEKIEMTSEFVLSRILTSLHQKRPSCFLLEVPPGCEESPDIITQLHSLVSKDSELSMLCATATADSVRDDEEFVDLLVREWLKQDDSIRSYWKEEGETLSDLPAPQRLNAFFSECVAKNNYWRILLVRRFDRLFRSMSGELLAVLRDLENELLLVTINAGPLPYGELYRRRSREDRGFTSDYGQIHVRLTIGAMPQKTAEKIWEEKYELPIDDRISRAYFEIAYELSGGLPIAFSIAAEYARNMEKFDPDLRFYRAELVERLPDAFDRVLQYDEREVNDKLNEAIMKMHLGTASSFDKQLVCSHPWNYLLLDGDSEKIMLKSEVIGRKALKIIQANRQRKKIDPIFLYEQGEYAACCAILNEMGPAFDKILFNAAQMLVEIFGDSPGNLYFRPTIKWGRVKQLANEAAIRCRDLHSREEFDHWRRIAEIHEAASDRGKDLCKIDKDNIHFFEDAAIRLGIRIIAVRGDRNPVTAAYSAIPLIEEVLRHYVGLVLRVSLSGSAFEFVDRDVFDQWWRRPTPFKYPEKNEILLGTNLTMLAAVVSVQRSKPLFDDPIEVARLLTLLEEGRNLLGHYVTTPNERMSKTLVEHAGKLLDRMCCHRGSELTIKEIEAWVKFPRRFLRQA